MFPRKPGQPTQPAAMGGGLFAQLGQVMGAAETIAKSGVLEKVIEFGNMLPRLIERLDHMESALARIEAAIELMPQRTDRAIHHDNIEPMHPEHLPLQVAMLTHDVRELLTIERRPVAAVEDQAA